MKLAYLVPEGQYHFLLDLVPELQQYGFTVYVNQIPDCVDLIFATMLPITHEFFYVVEGTDKPVVISHWDHYSFVNMKEERWTRFNSLLAQSKDPDSLIEVWSCGYETARLLKQQMGLDSVVMPGWIDAVKLRKGKDSVSYSTFAKPFAFYASSNNSLGKRTDWAVHACKMLDIPLVLTKGLQLSEQEYLDRMASCRLYLMTAFEESNATLPATEAAAMGKAVVCADLPSSKEVFGEDGAWYFRNDSFYDLLDKLSQAWQMPTLKTCKKRIIECFDLSVIAPKIVKRLRSFHAECQP